MQSKINQSVPYIKFWWHDDKIGYFYVIFNRLKMVHGAYGVARISSSASKSLKQMEHESTSLEVRCRGSGVRGQGSGVWGSGFGWKVAD